MHVQVVNIIVAFSTKKFAPIAWGIRWFMRHARISSMLTPEARRPAMDFTWTWRTPPTVLGAALQI
jgi:hypothetical protein